MGACQETTKWITENVLMPVERFITEAREACNQIDTWVEEQVSQPVESWISQTERAAASRTATGGARAATNGSAGW